MKNYMPTNYIPWWNRQIPRNTSRTIRHEKEIKSIQKGKEVKLSLEKIEEKGAC